jgi:hypothetical protein
MNKVSQVHVNLLRRKKEGASTFVYVKAPRNTLAFQQPDSQCLAGVNKICPVGASKKAVRRSQKYDRNRYTIVLDRSRIA